MILISSDLLSVLHVISLDCLCGPREVQVRKLWIH